MEWNVTNGEIAWAPLPPPAAPSTPRFFSCGLDRLSGALLYVAGPRQYLQVRPRRFEGQAQVEVYSNAPPRVEFVRQVARTQVVTVVPNRIAVTGRDHPLVRVEVQSQTRPRVEVPVGPRFRQRGDTAASAAKVRVTPQTETRRPVQVEPENAPAVRDVTGPENKVRVVPKSDQGVPVNVQPEQ